MTGKCYYLTTLGAWSQHAERFENSHFIILASSPEPATSVSIAPDSREAGNCDAPPLRNDLTPILVLFEGDEGAHLAFEVEPAVTPLPHPLAQRPLSERVNAALAPHGVPENATTFDAAEILARIHPLLRHRVF